MKDGSPMTNESKQLGSDQWRSRIPDPSTAPMRWGIFLPMKDGTWEWGMKLKLVHTKMQRLKKLVWWPRKHDVFFSYMIASTVPCLDLFWIGVRAIPNKRERLTKKAMLSFPLLLIAFPGICCLEKEIHETGLSLTLPYCLSTFPLTPP